MTDTILVLGGYGTTGRTLCGLLLEHGQGDIVVAGRHLDRAQAAADELAVRYPGRVTARAADAADAASLARALDGVGLVAVAASVLEHAGTIARAAADAGVDYFDLLLSGEDKFAALERLRPRLEAEGRCFITDGGIHPGLSAVLVRALAPAFSRLERASVGGLLKVDWAAYDFQQETIYEFANEFRDYRVEALRDGEWAKLDWRDATRTFDFGAPWCDERCTLMYMKELELLPVQLSSLRDCGFYVSGFNPAADAVVMLGLVVLKAGPLAMKPYARLLAWTLRRSSRPPYGTVFQAEAGGTGRRGEALEAGLRITHPDGYWLTAAAAAACLLQWQDGSLREPGLHLQALAADPARMLRDLQRMGAGIQTRGVDAGELVAG